MDLSITQVPVWLSILFIISFMTAPVFLIVHAVKSAYQNGSIKNNSIINKRIVFFYWGYFAVVALVSLSGFFEKNVFPPRIVFTTVVPLFLFYWFYVLKSDWFKTIFKHLKLEQLIWIHLFRFVGVFFFLVYFYDAIPKTFAFIGGTGDILTAVLVFPLVYTIKKTMEIC